MRRARAAMAEFADADQARIDEAVTALAWALYNPAHAKELAELAVADTKLGNVPDKIIKKTAQDLRHLARPHAGEDRSASSKRTRSAASSNTPSRSAWSAAITPSTNPGATPVNKAMMAIKGRNADHHRRLARRA